MKTCPVCGDVHASYVCPECGFDDSCNYEAYLTLQKVGVSPKTIAARKAEFLHGSKDFVIRNKVLVKYTGNAANPVIPEGITKIGEDAFRENEYIKSVVIPEGVKKIGAGAFAECPELTQVQLPQSLRAIGMFAFSECPLESIELPEGLVSLGDEGAFYGTNIKKLVVPGSIEKIPVQSFAGCNALEEVILKPGVLSIDHEAFGQCKNLKTVTIPDTLETVAASGNNLEGSFDQCEKLTTVIATEVWRRNHADVLRDIFKSTMTADAQYQEGENYYQAKRYRDAFFWYHKAAKRGHALAQCQLGLLYRDGLGVFKDEGKAFIWFMKAAEEKQNCPRGKFYVGQCHDHGIGVPRNIQRAIQWYTLAAQQGDAKALMNLGLCYKFGDGVEKNPAEAERLLSLAAKQRNA